MALRINKIPITSARLFREHFSLSAVFPLLPVVVRQEGASLFHTETDVRVLRLLQATCAEDFTMPSIASREGVVEVTWQDEVLPLPVLPADFVPQHLRHLQAALLCQLAHHRPTPEDLEPYAQSLSAAESSPLQADLIVLQNDEELLLPLFDFCRQFDAPIRTVAIRNTSAFGGVAHLLVQNAEGRIIDHVRLGNGTTVYANCLGARLIELLPQLSASSDHSNYMDYAASPAPQLCRRMRSDASVSAYSPELSEGITQFCADDERGLLGVRRGQLLAMTNLFNPMNDLQFQLVADEHVVKVAVKGHLLIVLTSRGRTFSNVDSMELEDIVSVGISENYVIHALTAEGRLLFSHQPAEDVPTADIYAVHSADPDTLCIQTRDGSYHLPSGRTMRHIGKLLTTGTRDYLLDPASGDLYDTLVNTPLAKRVDDFLLAKNRMATGSFDLLAYDGSVVVRISLAAS